MDLQAAYLQLPLCKDDREKIAIITPEAHYKFNFLPFGLSIASQSMQRTMHVLFWDLLDKFVKIFLDDLAIHSVNPEDHPAQLDEVLSRLAHAGLLIAVKEMYIFSVIH